MHLRHTDALAMIRHAAQDPILRTMTRMQFLNQLRNLPGEALDAVRKAYGDNWEDTVMQLRKRVTSAIAENGKDFVASEAVQRFQAAKTSITFTGRARESPACHPQRDMQTQKGRGERGAGRDVSRGDMWNQHWLGDGD